VHKSLLALILLSVIVGSPKVQINQAPVSPPPTAKPCEERMLWAIADGQKPIYNNRIFSKALPYYIRFVGVAERREQISDAIGSALQNALTQWGAALLAIKTELDPQLRAYVESMLLCEEGHCTYSAPPAVQMQCQQNAAMVIIVYDGDSFPASQQWVAGLARLEGRTILLNAHDFRFIYDQTLFYTWNAAGNLNLTPILVHELGHSFGLSHSTALGSIMRADLSALGERRFATPSDGLAFAKVLKKSVDGGVPGEFAISDCSGVYVGKPPKI
jgi:predicted Zn-dependent protease